MSSVDGVPHRVEYGCTFVESIHEYVVLAHDDEATVGKMLRTGAYLDNRIFRGTEPDGNRIRLTNEWCSVSGAVYFERVEHVVWNAQNGVALLPTVRQTPSVQCIWSGGQ